MGHYFVIGLNHKTAAVQLRERLYFREQEISESLSTIVKMTSLDEVMIVSTCNRVEIIGVCLRLDKVFDILVHFMARIKGLMTDEIKDALYFLTIISFFCQPGAGSHIHHRDGGDSTSPPAACKVFFRLGFPPEA